jgi:gliding motility-associated protein GldE
MKQRAVFPLLMGTFSLSFPPLLPELMIIIGILAVSLLLSALRAAYAVTSTSDAPWERRSQTDYGVLEPVHKLTLSLFQRASTLFAFLLVTRLFWVVAQDPTLSLYSWVPVLALVVWLWIDAMVRYLAGRNAISLTQKATPIIRPIMKILSPLSVALTSWGTKWGILLNEQAESRGERLETDGDNEDERELLRGLATFGQRAARQAMQPRLNITAVDIELDFHELMDKINKSGYSRIPVYQDSLDSVEGILYVKDLLPHLHRDEHFSWQKLLRKAYFIPESKRLDDLMQEFQNRRVHMAVVVDEYGGTSGLITLEDIIEEIFGDINDEYDDADEVNFTQVDDKTYIFEGKVLINDFCRILSLDSNYFEEVRGGSESLGGLLLELFSRLPLTGEQATHREVAFKVQSADKKRIKKVRIQLG